MFQREDNDLHCEMPISFTTAALGGEIEIPDAGRHRQDQDPDRNAIGKVFRLRGKGIKGVRSQAHGDLLCHVVVETPVNLTARQKELLQELEAINQQDAGRHDPRAKSWMERVKEFFQALRSVRRLVDQSRRTCGLRCFDSATSSRRSARTGTLPSVAANESLHPSL